MRNFTEGNLCEVFIISGICLCISVKIDHLSFPETHKFGNFGNFVQLLMETNW